MPEGRRFQPGISGNPGGRPKGSHTFSLRETFAEAFSADPTVRPAVIEKLRNALKNGGKSFLPTLELGARLNREIGIGSDAYIGGVTINIYSNVRRGRLK